MSFNPYAFISQPLLLTLAQILGVAPQIEIPTQPLPETNGPSLSSTQKAALIAILGSVGIASTGLAIAADKFSKTRIEIVEHKGRPKGSFEKLEEFIKRNKKGLSTLGALLVAGGLTAIYSQMDFTIPLDDGSQQMGTIQPLATGLFYPTLGGAIAEP